MTRLIWGAGPPMFHRGLSRGVLYSGESAVPWNGLVAIDEKETGSINVEHYFDGSRMRISQDIGDFVATLSAYTYPDVFNQHHGRTNEEDHTRFGLTYRVEYGDGYLLHLAYNMFVRDTEKARSTIAATLNPQLFSWDIYAESIEVPGASPASHLILAVPRNEIVLSILEDILYGTDNTEPRLPLPAEVIEIYESHTTMRVTYLGDGTYTVTGPEDMVILREDGSFDISSPTANYLGPGQDTFVVSSY